jgi:glutamate-1-semialdehyde 2,1-aminomutase
MQRKNSESLFNNAKDLFPGGVNSPVRAFKSVDGVPLFMKKGEGAYITDEDDNEFIDFCCSWGPLINGHADPEVIESISEIIKSGTSFGAPTRKENELAHLIVSNHKYIDKIRFVSSGTEAVMSAVRLARGYTGKDKIVKFDGCYHGHADSLLVNAGSGLATLGTSSSAGVPESFSKETIVLPLNDIEALDKCLEKYANEISCIIIEPIPANNGLLLQEESFLKYLREVCTKHGILLFFDEVISGFRVGFEGAAGFYDIQPDLITFGKIIGGGLPVGAYGGKEEIMNIVSPLGNVYQAGTLSGNPVAMAAGVAQLNKCLRPNFYEDQEKRTKLFVDSVKEHASKNNYNFEIYSIGSIFWFAFGGNGIRRSASDIDAKSMEVFKGFYNNLLKNGLYFGPSGYEVGFVSSAHNQEIIQVAIDKFCKSLDQSL